MNLLFYYMFKIRITVQLGPKYALQGVLPVQLSNNECAGSKFRKDTLSQIINENFDMCIGGYTVEF